MTEHISALILGFILDLIIGDPYSIPHPVIFIGKLIAFLEKKLYPAEYDSVRDTGKGSENSESNSSAAGWSIKGRTLFIRGLILVAAVLLITAAVSSGFIFILRKYCPPFVPFIIEVIMSWQILAVKCMHIESMKVYTALCAGDIEGARTALSMIVGRDTDKMDDKEVIISTIETVAEGTCDAVMAPMFYLLIGGPVLGFIYKAVNTMDSMIGYRNDRYEYFGKAAARLDDIMNFLPSRIAAFLMILNSFFIRGLNGRNAFSVYKKDRYAHDSINAGHTESAAAGALNIRLGGDTCYKGFKKKRAFIGDTGYTRDPELNDIKHINNLMYYSAFAFILISLGLGCLLFALHTHLFHFLQ